MNSHESQSTNWDGQFAKSFKLPEMDVRTATPQQWEEYTRISFIHGAYEKADAALKETQDWQVHADLREKVDYLLDGIQQGRKDLAKVSYEKAGDIINRYDYVDAQEYETKDDWIRARLHMFEGGVQIASDVDKTITNGDSYLSRIPGSIQAENYMAHQDHGRNTFPLVHSRYWSPALQHPESRQQFFNVGRSVTIRPGVSELLIQAKEQNIPVNLISANFMPFIEGVCSNLPAETITAAYAVKHDDITATDKGTLVKGAAVNEPLKALIYIGDGSSDLPAMDEDARKLVGVYFALEGEEFAKKLDEAGLPYYTYRDFNDIKNKLEELGVL